MRIAMTVVGMGIAIGLVIGAMPVGAHHAFSAAFDENKPINLQGVVTKVELVNPATNEPLPVKDEKGKPIKYSILAKAGYKAPRVVE